MTPAQDASFSLGGRRVFVAGHKGMVGSALVRRLEREPCEILTVERGSVDLRRQAETERWFSEQRPDSVILAAARVGGILANDSRPAEFLYDNLAIEANVVEAAFRTGVSKLLFLGSSCIYPRLAAQPIPEEALLTGPLEPTNECYAVAKIAGIKLCQAYRRQHGCDFISAMPTNLYGPGDNFDLEGSHVIPALIRKFHEAKTGSRSSVEIWGSGEVRREFLHVDDCADALVHLLQGYSGEVPVNVGCGDDLTIADLARLISEATGFRGELRFDRSKPDGTPRKLLDIARLRALGWQPTIDLAAGLRETYLWFQQNREQARLAVS